MRRLQPWFNNDQKIGKRIKMNCPRNWKRFPQNGASPSQISLSDIPPATGTVNLKRPNGTPLYTGTCSISAASPTPNTVCNFVPEASEASNLTCSFEVIYRVQVNLVQRSLTFARNIFTIIAEFLRAIAAFVVGLLREFISYIRDVIIIAVNWFYEIFERGGDEDDEDDDSDEDNGEPRPETGDRPEYNPNDENQQER